MSKEMLETWKCLRAERKVEHAKPWHQVEQARLQQWHHYISVTQSHPLVFRYDSFGRLTNVTFPTGQVSSFRSDTDSSVHVQVETSSKDDVTITTNLSASGAFYTLLQGKPVGDWGLGDSGVGRPPLEKDDTRNELLLLQLPRTERRGNWFLTVSPPHLQNTPA